MRKPFWKWCLIYFKYKRFLFYSCMVENASAVKVFVQSPLLATMSHKYCIYECYETFFMLREGCIDMLICCCFFLFTFFYFSCTVCLSAVGVATQTDSIPGPNISQMPWTFKRAAVMIKSYIPNCVFEASNTAPFPLQRFVCVPFPLPALIDGLSLWVRSRVQSLYTAWRPLTGGRRESSECEAPKLGWDWRKAGYFRGWGVGYPMVNLGPRGLPYIQNADLQLELVVVKCCASPL